MEIPKVIDADGHIYENHEEIEEYFEGKYQGMRRARAYGLFPSLDGWPRGLGAGRPADKLLIGIGMMPRGEVGLVFAAIGRTLGVINDAVFSAIVLMIVVTTVIAPPLLKLAIARQSGRPAAI